MSFIKKLLKKDTKPKASLPTWEEMVSTLHDKQLDCFRDEVVKVIYSKDNSKRCIVLKNEKGIFTYSFEKIYVCKDEELIYFGNIYPARWEPDFKAGQGISLFEKEEELLKDLKAHPYYKMYFI